MKSIQIPSVLRTSNIRKGKEKLNILSFEENLHFVMQTGGSILAAR